MAKNGAHAHICAYVFGHFGANWAESFLWEPKRPLSLDCWTLVRNPSYDAYFSVLIFLGHFWRENGRSHHPLWFGASKPDQNVGPLGEHFGPRSISLSEIVFSTLDKNQILEISGREFYPDVHVNYIFCILLV